MSGNRLRHFLGGCQQFLRAAEVSNTVVYVAHLVPLVLLPNLQWYTIEEEVSMSGLTSIETCFKNWTKILAG